MSSLIIIFLCALFAFSLSAICGGGAGLLLMPILGALIPISQVPAALSIGTFSSSSSRIILFYKNIHWPIVKYFVPSALPAVWLGAYLLKFINPIYLEIIMGLFLISNIPLIFKAKKDIQQYQKPKNVSLCVIGFIAGALSGLTGAVGLLFNKFYLKFGLSNEEIIATRAANEVVLHLIKIILYVAFGLINKHVLTIGLLVALAAILSSFSMKFILHRLSIVSFKKIGYSAMVISGLIMLMQSGNSLMKLNRGEISSNIISKGLETKMQWQNANYAMEFTYDDGFEFEQVIPINELNNEQLAKIKNQGIDSDKIIVEKVHTLNSQYFEAYYFKDQKLLKKVEFQ